MLISRIYILHIIINWSFPHSQKQLRLGYNFEFYRVKPKLIHRSYSWSKGCRFRSRIQGGCPQPLPLSFYSSQPEPKSCSEPRFLKIWKHNIKNKVCQNPDAPYFFFHPLHFARVPTSSRWWSIPKTGDILRPKHILLQLFVSEGDSLSTRTFLEGNSKDSFLFSNSKMKASMKLCCHYAIGFSDN